MFIQTMRLVPKILCLFLLSICFACAVSDEPKPATPLETLQAYGRAFKKKDTTAMKLLLSQETLKMHEQEAKAQNVTLDDIIKRETLFSENQTTAEYRNQKIEDDKASIQMKDSLGMWNTVQFVREDGLWKIDRKSFADQIEQDSEESNKKIDEIINQGRQP